MQAKKFLLCGLLSGFIGCMLFSCRKTAVLPPVIPADSLALFSATVNGVTWQTDTLSAFLVNGGLHHYKIMTISGYSPNRVITVSLEDTSANGPGANDSTVSPGAYNITHRISLSAFSYVNDRIRVGRDSVWQQQGSAVSGQANVTASDGIGKTISGTFAFTAIVLNIDSTGRTSLDSVVVTQGLFRNIPYTYFHHQ